LNRNLKKNNFFLLKNEKNKYLTLKKIGKSNPIDTQQSKIKMFGISSWLLSAWLELSLKYLVSRRLVRMTGLRDTFLFSTNSEFRQHIQYVSLETDFNTFFCFTTTKQIQFIHSSILLNFLVGLGR